MGYFEALLVATLKILPTVVVGIVGYLLARAVKGVDTKIDSLASTDAEIKAQLAALASTDTEIKMQLSELQVRVTEIEAKLKGFTFRTPKRRRAKRKAAP